MLNMLLEQHISLCEMLSDCYMVLYVQMLFAEKKIKF